MSDSRMSGFSADGSGQLSSPFPVETTQKRLPMMCADEIDTLTARYGRPVHRLYNVLADEYIYSYRWRKETDRRAEVVFAIQDESGRIWVHAKPHYPMHIYRLPSGGIHLDESVEDALYREVYEETGLNVRIKRFLGLIEYRFYRGISTAKFASYVFHLYSDGGFPVMHEGEQILEFRAILPSQISQLAVDLRNLIGDRRGWGQWRALVHDLVDDYLSS